MALQGSSRSRHFNFRFQPDFSIIEVVLGAFAHMDACPLLITSIVAVKPEDQGTFFQDFFGLIRLSGGFFLTLLCSVPEMLRTTMKTNGWRYAPHAFCGVLRSMGGIGHHPGALPGRDNAALAESTSSHANCLTARRACARRPQGRQSHHHTCTAPNAVRCKCGPDALCRGSGALSR